jgi:hypothetical protein
MLIGAQIGLDTYLTRKRREAAAPPRPARNEAVPRALPAG